MKLLVFYNKISSSVITWVFLDCKSVPEIELLNYKVMVSTEYVNQDQKYIQFSIKYIVFGKTYW